MASLPMTDLSKRALKTTAEVQGWGTGTVTKFQRCRASVTCCKCEGGSLVVLFCQQKTKQLGLLFLDEITSGLDTTSAYKIMKIIFKLAYLGHTVLLTLHQPTSRMFNLLLKQFLPGEFFALLRLFLKGQVPA